MPDKIFSGKRSAAQLIDHDTLTAINLDTLELAPQWWNASTWRLQIPAGFNAVEVHASCHWQKSLGGTVRRVTVQSQELLQERADNRQPEHHETFLTTVQVVGFFHNPSLSALALVFGVYHDAGVPLAVYEACLFARCWVE